MKRRPHSYLKKLKAIAACLLAVAMLSACANSQPTTLEVTTPMNTQPQTQPPRGSGMKVLEYPASAVQTKEERGISLKDFCSRGAAETSYEGNGHLDGTNLIISPYFSGSVNETALPIYATPVFVATGSYGVIHSFASVDVDFERFQMVTVTLTLNLPERMQFANVYSHDNAVLSYSEDTIRMTVTKHGAYTIVINDKQDYAITVFVRTYEDEDAQIAAYRQAYGAENVTVYEPGLHEIDYLQMKANTVLYLKAGALLLPKHTVDIKSDSDDASKSEFGAKQSNGMGLHRYPVINGYNAENMVIAGRGTVDMTQLDWHERRGIVFTLSNGVTMDGMIVINPCEWAFITYRCENVTVTQSAVLGYRTNSDAFAICNSINVQVTDCFARTGDDMFEVKTLGGVDGAVSRDITFSRCQAWGSKARCFGITGEIEKDISNILFENGIVIFRDAVWDNNRIGSLVVLREVGNGVVDGVTFRNINIHHDAGRAFQVGVYNNKLSGSTIQNIVFESIACTALNKGQIRLNEGEGNTVSVTLRKIAVNGAILTKVNAGTYFIWDAEGLFTIE